MEADFWHERWKLGETAFHEKQANQLLVNHVDKLQIEKESRVFLPLCGKTTDIAYLLDLGYHVIGVELSELAIEELFQDLDVSPSITTVNTLTLYQTEGIDIYVGDIFDLDVNALGNIDAIYDRAALVALPLEMRKTYTQHLTKITENAQQLLICFEYDQAGLNGPPFSISADEVAEHYESHYSLACVEESEVMGGLKKKVEAKECAWLLTPRSS